MKKIVYLFDGQGAFKPGVGKDLYNRYAKAREIIEKAGKILGYDLTAHLWGEDSARTSSMTSIAQPAISVVSLAYVRVLETMGVKGEISLGHSLGEATALVYCQTLSHEDGLRMIKKRGELMEKGGREGGMMAIVNIEPGLLENECAKVTKETGAPVVVANINAPNQIVISGAKESIKKIAQFAAQNRGRGIPLEVGGAWHSPYLKDVAREFSVYLDELKFHDPGSKFYSVVDQKVQTSALEIRSSFKKQMLAQVNWVKAVENLIGLGYNTFLEIGPSRILKDLVNKINADIKVESVALYTELETLVNLIK